MTPEEKRQFAEMKQELEMIKACTDPAFVAAIRELAFTDVAFVGTSAKTGASETQAVNEAGAGTYNVAAPPTGFIDINGNNVPYY